MALEPWGVNNEYLQNTEISEHKNAAILRCTFTPIHVYTYISMSDKNKYTLPPILWATDICYFVLLN